ncbi:sensor histidine kinase [Kytococcus sp. Marseille-QA3725]
MSDSTRGRSEDLELLRWAYTLSDAARRHPVLADAATGAAVVVVFTAATAWTLPWWALLWSAAYLLAYLLRSVSLVAMLVAFSVLGVAQVVFTDTMMPGNFIIPLAIYKSTSHGRRLVRLAALVLLLVASVPAGFDFAPTGVGAVVMMVIYAAGLFLPWMLGDLMQHRRAVMAREGDQQAALARDREQRAQLAVRSERAAIAREMHDIIAHSLSVVIVQADGGRYAAQAGAVEGAQTALEQIATTAREALGETRRLVGVLRDPDLGAEYSPGQGLGDLPTLIERLEDSSLPVQAILDPSLAEAMGQTPQHGVEQVTVTPSLSAAAYRVVQEATTNVIKHAGPVTVVRIRVQVAGPYLTISVADDGAGPTQRQSSGHGILGMHERVAALDGELLTGMRSGGGFLVRARFPLSPNASGTRRRRSRQFVPPTEMGPDLGPEEPGWPTPVAQPAAPPAPATEERPEEEAEITEPQGLPPAPFSVTHPTATPCPLPWSSP